MIVTEHRVEIDDQTLVLQNLITIRISEDVICGVTQYSLVVSI